jgi:predicted phage baseplate assembly protein
VLPTPNLDDRSFQNLVDDARRLVHRRCPEWSEHNISDPGITLIETVAMMVDQLIYRLNRVPERNYVKFLELLGLELRPPGAAQGEVTFWLSAPQPQTVTVRSETEVSTDRTDIEEPIVFSTTEQLDIVPCSLHRGHVVTVSAGGDTVEHANEHGGLEFACFSTLPTPGDALLIGLSNAVPSGAVLLRFDCRVSGVGVDPDDPPYVWEAWTGGPDWTRCDVERDETRAFNRPGDVILHVPAGHVVDTPAPVHTMAQGWLRCRLVAPSPGQPSYREPPMITSIEACTVGGTTRIVHARVVRDEALGVSDGTPGQRFSLENHPVLPWSGSSLVVSTGDAIGEWQAVEHFAEADDASPWFHIDSVAGEVVFGPGVRERDGTVRQYGAIPPKGTVLKMSAYRTGGGARGNVSIGQIRVLKTSVPYVSRVENRRAAVGGAQAETVEEIKLRGPLALRTRGKAVTAEDFEQLTLEVAPEIGRAQCLTAAHESHAGVVRVLVVPQVATDRLGAVRREDLDPLPETVERIAGYLDERRLVGTRVMVEPPMYLGLTVIIKLTALPSFPHAQVHDNVLRALNRLFHPLNGGVDGSGWPMGRAVQLQEVAGALAWIPGVNLSEEVAIRLFPADLTTGERDQAVDRFPLPRNGLVHSYQHEVWVR